MFKLKNLTTIYRARLIAETYDNYLIPKTRVLDVGCGTGIIGKFLRDEFKVKITGCDIKNYLQTNIPFRLIKKNKLPCRRDEFDVILLNDVLHHISYKKQKTLLHEALEKVDQVLIFELPPSLFNKLFDYLLNKLHYPNLPITGTYKNVSQWNSFFETNKIKYTQLRFDKPFFYPFSHIAYSLSK